MTINGTPAHDFLEGTPTDDPINGLAGDDALYSQGGNDTLFGGVGNDVLDGGRGADSMDGGTGNDTYVVDNLFDEVVEGADSGVDEVVSSINYTLGANVETLKLIGGEPINATGNAVGNYIVGNTADNVVSGLAGDDALYGQGGNDTLLGGLGNDVLDGATGADSMDGGTGNDTYIVDNLFDEVVEGADSGVDEVVSSINYTLGANVETLKLIGGEPINATGNALGNYIVGNTADNVVSGLAGDDDLYGQGGNDTLSGGLGNDVLDGGTGADSMDGGAGNDTYIVDNPLDEIVEKADSGVDEAVSSVNYTLAPGANVEYLKLIGGAPISATGNALDNPYITGNNADNVLSGLGGDDDLYGQGGNDTLSGGLGNDELDGGTGADSMDGGAGNDTYIVDNPLDEIVEGADPGVDEVVSSVNYTLAPGADVETLKLIGGEPINATGNALDNPSIVGNYADNVLSGLGGDDDLYGQGGNDTLLGGLGNDVLDGGTGADSMDGGAGNDTYMVDNLLDEIVEGADPGVDEVVSSVNYTLAPGADVETLKLIGGEPINATGNALDNPYITGNNGSNVLSGLGGDDDLYGRGGNDTLLGGLGNDELDGGTGVDSVDGGAGNDTYMVDNLLDEVVEGADAGVDGVVSSVNHTLGANVETLKLSGGEPINGTGNALGNYIVGNTADNVVSGLAGEDALYGQGGNDTLLGGLGNDELDGGTGADSMDGGTGNDTYFVDNLLDEVVEGADAGVDGVVSSVNHTLGANVETLKLSGGEPINGTGNALGNYILGNDADNVVSGLAGDDALYGQGGNDTLSGGLGNDVLDGDTGADSMDGGTGNDALVGGSHKDTMTGGAGADIFVFRFVSDSPVGTPDVINDFQGLGVSPEDLINMSSIDADLMSPGNQAFVWVGEQPVHPGELGYSNGNLWGNVFGLPDDVTSEFQVAIPDSVVVSNDVIL